MYFNITRYFKDQSPPSLTTPCENHERYVPALARAHLAAESVISANKVSLGLWEVEAGGGERREMPPSSNDLPFARNIHARARARDTCARACMYRRVVHVHNLAAVVSLEQGGIIRSATINPNDDDDAAAERASWRSSRTSFQATSVTLRAHLSPPPLSIPVPLFSFPSHFVFPFSPCLSLSWFLHLSLFIPASTSISSLFVIGSPSLVLHLLSLFIARSLVQLALPSSLPTFFKLLVLTSVLRDRKLSSFHNHFAGTIRQQFLSTVETRDCNCVLSEHSNNSNVQ